MVRNFGGYIWNIYDIICKSTSGDYAQKYFKVLANLMM
jgi:hypothetical protein